MSVWRLNPIMPELNSPSNNIIDGDSVPDVSVITAMLGLGGEASNIALTEVTSGFYVYSYALDTDIAVIYMLVKYES